MRATQQIVADRPTPESIARAKQAQQRERDEITARTGLVVTECPMCSYVSIGESLGQATRSITAHLVRAHHLRKEA